MSKNQSIKLKFVDFCAGIGAGRLGLQNVLELVNDTWNYFPHKIIGGLSPAEKLLEYREKQK